MENLLRQVRDLLYELANSFDELASTRGIGEIKEMNKGMSVNMEDLTVNVNGYIRQLSYNECVILSELAKAKNNFCTYEHLSEVVYGYKLDDSSKKSLHTCVSRLRCKTNGLLIIKSIKNRGIKITEVYDDNGN